MRILAVVLALGMGGMGMSGCSSTERKELAKSGIELAVQRVGSVLAAEMVDDGSFTPEEIDKVTDFFERKARSMVDRIWKKVEDKLNEEGRHDGRSESDPVVDPESQVFQGLGDDGILDHDRYDAGGRRSSRHVRGLAGSARGDGHGLAEGGHLHPGSD